MRNSKSVWQNRRNTDMYVSTQCGHCFPCHREQLTECSPIFAKMFEWIEESKKHKQNKDYEVVFTEMIGWNNDFPNFKIEGDKNAIEGMLQFLYDGTLSSNIDASLVLQLAHKYKIKDLVIVAATRILESVKATKGPV